MKTLHFDKLHTVIYTKQINFSMVTTFAILYILSVLVFLSSLQTAHSRSVPISNTFSSAAPAFTDWTDLLNYFHTTFEHRHTPSYQCPVHTSIQLRECCFHDGCGEYICAPAGGIVFDECYGVSFGLSQNCVFRRVECCVQDRRCGASSGLDTKRCFTHEYGGDWYFGDASGKHPSKTLRMDFFCEGLEKTASTQCIGERVLDEARVIGKGVETVLTKELTQYLLSSNDIASTNEFGINWDSDWTIVAERTETNIDDDSGVDELNGSDNEIVVYDDVVGARNNSTDVMTRSWTRLSSSLLSLVSSQSINKTETKQNAPIVRARFNYLASRWATVWTNDPHSRAVHAAARLLTKRAIEAKIRDYTWRAYFLRIVTAVQLSPVEYRLQAQYRVKKIRF